MAPETDLFSRGEFLPLEENDVSSVIEAHNSLDWDKNQDRDNGEPARPTTKLINTNIYHVHNKTSAGQF